MDETTRRQINWIILIALVLSLIVWGAGRRSELDNLRAVLSYGSPADRQVAVQRLVNTQKLAEGLKNQPRWIQDEAVEAVAFLGTPKAIFQLLTAWTVVDAPVQPRILRVVSRFGPLAIPPTVEAMTDKDGTVRAGTVGVLTALGEPVIPYLLPLMTAWDDYIRVGVAGVFGGIGEPVIPELIPIMKRTQPLPDQEPAEFLRQKETATNSLLNMKEKAVGAIVAELLSVTDQEVRAQAVTMLGAIGSGVKPEVGVVVVAPLLKHVTADTSWTVRRRAVNAVATLGELALLNGAVAPLKARLGDARPEVRAAAAEALGKIGAVEAAPLLAATLVQNTSGATREISGALVRLGEPSIGALMAAQALTSASVDVRLAATRAISQIGSPQSVTPLALALGDSASGEVRRTAALALRNLPPEALNQSAAVALSALSKSLMDADWQVYYAARDAMAKMGAPAVSSLVAALGNPSARVAHMAEMALAQIGAPAVPKLVEAVLTGHVDLASWASIALGDIGEPSVEPLKKIIANPSASVTARTMAAQGLGRTRMPEAAETLQNALQAPEAAVRVAAIKGLAELSVPETTASLITTLGDPEVSVRDAGMEVMKNWRMGDAEKMLQELLTGDDRNASYRAAIALVYQKTTVANELLQEVAGRGTTDQQLSQQLTPVLLKAAQDPAVTLNVRADALLGLGYVGTSQALSQLKALVVPGNPLVVQAAQAVAMIGNREYAEAEGKAKLEMSEAAKALLNLVTQPPSPEVQVAAAAALGLMGEVPVDHLLDSLTSGNEDSRAWSAAILAMIGKPATDKLMRLRGATKDQAQKTWSAASLTVIGDAMALQVMKHLPEEEQPRAEQLQAVEERVAAVYKVQTR